MILPLVLLAALSNPVRGSGIDDDELPDGDKLVQVTLFSDHEAVKPGGTVTLAVRYAIEPKWHIYWENPGDSGLATRAEFTLPDGWKVATPRFPAPERHESPGDIVTYVFEDELVLLADVTVPADAKPGSKVTLNVEGRWLVCTDLCVPGSGKSSVEITVADSNKSANEALFTAARARLPKPWSELKQARAGWSGDEAEPRLVLAVSGATEIDFFPLDFRPLSMASRTVDVGKSGATLRANFTFKRKTDKDEPRIRGVLHVRTADGEASYLLDHLYTPPKSGE